MLLNNLLSSNVSNIEILHPWKNIPGDILVVLHLRGFLYIQLLKKSTLHYSNCIYLRTYLPLKYIEFQIKVI